MTMTLPVKAVRVELHRRSRRRRARRPQARPPTPNERASEWRDSRRAAGHRGRRRGVDPSISLAVATGALPLRRAALGVAPQAAQLRGEIAGDLVAELGSFSSVRAMIRSSSTAPWHQATGRAGWRSRMALYTTAEVGPANACCP